MNTCNKMSNQLCQGEEMKSQKDDEIQLELRASITFKAQMLPLPFSVKLGHVPIPLTRCSSCQNACKAGSSARGFRMKTVLLYEAESDVGFD